MERIITADEARKIGAEALAVLNEIGSDPKRLVAHLAGVTVDDIDNLGGLPA